MSLCYQVVKSILILIVEYSFFFFFNDTATTEIYTLSLHDALPIFAARMRHRRSNAARKRQALRHRVAPPVVQHRSEEHTSELQSQSNLVCRLLLEKKKKKTYPTVYLFIQHVIRRHTAVRCVRYPSM